MAASQLPYNTTASQLGTEALAPGETLKHTAPWLAGQHLQAIIFRPPSGRAPSTAARAAFLAGQLVPASFGAASEARITRTS